MEKYRVENGAWSAEIESERLDDVMQMADEAVDYTGANLVICDAQGNRLAERPWWGVPYDARIDPDERPIEFGGFGYYGDWVLY